jgi:hypothetical protein
MGKSGRRVFVVLVREFDEVLRLTKEVVAALHLTYEPRQRIEIAYLAFFYGVGKHSTPALRNALRDYPNELISGVVDKLEQSRATVKKDLSFEHDPFDGHQLRLGHYFRHLYQSIKFVHSIPAEVEKYEFAKTLRAQLTNHEQILLYYNSLSRIGRAWETEGLITEYKLIKDIPQGFVTELDPKEVYSHLKFEWEE